MIGLEAMYHRKHEPTVVKRNRPDAPVRDESVRKYIDALKANGRMQQFKLRKTADLANYTVQRVGRYLDDLNIIKIDRFKVGDNKQQVVFISLTGKEYKYK